MRSAVMRAEGREQCSVVVTSQPTLPDDLVQCTGGMQESRVAVRESILGSVRAWRTHSWYLGHVAEESARNVCWTASTALQA